CQSTMRRRRGARELFLLAGLHASVLRATSSARELIAFACLGHRHKPSLFSEACVIAKAPLLRPARMAPTRRDAHCCCRFGSVSAVRVVFFRRLRRSLAPPL